MISAPKRGLTLTVTIRIPMAGLVPFQAYEDAVLPLLSEHCGALQRRLRNEDGTFEVHIVHFASRLAFESYRADPRRAAAAPLLTASGAISEMTEMTDVA